MKKGHQKEYYSHHTENGQEFYGQVHCGIYKKKKNKKRNKMMLEVSLKRKESETPESSYQVSY